LTTPDSVDRISGMKDQAVKLRGQDMRYAKDVKRELPNCSTTEIIGATLFGWRFLTAEQKLAALKRDARAARSGTPEPSAA
jgi:hypothetical protein